tara:strand:- start:177 stop:407 length:231 start_codon:yes stop_codon:yes gene_type:complete
MGGADGGEYLSAFTRKPDDITEPPGAGDVELEGGCEVDETEEASMEETEPALLDQARGCVGMVLEMPLFCCICCCC